MIRRFMHKLGISRDRIQFIMTIASMPDGSEDDRKAVMKFLHDLTSAPENHKFCYLRGDQKDITGLSEHDIASDKFMSCNTEKLESPDSQLEELNNFWSGTTGSNAPFITLESACEWMYGNIAHYRPFNALILSGRTSGSCRTCTGQ